MFLGCSFKNLIATIDYNQKQIDGSLDEVLPMGNLKTKIEAFDWIVLEEKNHLSLDPYVLFTIFTKGTAVSFLLLSQELFI